MLFIEYDVTEDGQIELVALINAIEEDGDDPDGEAWLTWRRSHEDGGHGSAPVLPEDLALMEATEDLTATGMINCNPPCPPPIRRFQINVSVVG
jgi:hypothetical protein